MIQALAIVIYVEYKFTYAPSMGNALDCRELIQTTRTIGPG